MTRRLCLTQLKLHLDKIGGHCPRKVEIKLFLKARNYMIGRLTLNQKGYSKSNKAQ